MKSISADSPLPVPFKMRPAYEELRFEDDSDTDSDESWIQDARLALQLQDHEDQLLRQELAQLVRQAQKQFNVEDRRGDAPLAPQLQNDMGDWQLHQLQDEFDAEDRRLRQEQEELACFVQATFQCSICMDEVSEEDIAKIDGCMHIMCRTCLRGFVSSKIQEHRYPILCPVCIAETDKRAEPSGMHRVCYPPVFVMPT